MEKGEVSRVGDCVRACVRLVVGVHGVFVGAKSLWNWRDFAIGLDGGGESRKEAASILTVAGALPGLTRMESEEIERKITNDQGEGSRAMGAQQPSVCSLCSSRKRNGYMKMRTRCLIRTGTKGGVDADEDGRRHWPLCTPTYRVPVGVVVGGSCRC